MIHSIEIKNFRCFENLKIKTCNRINLIVGDNGAGKTALLEAIFFALGNSPQLSIRFRQNRGLESNFTGGLRRIEEAIWRDFFFASDWKREISIKLLGGGPESRSVKISRGKSKQSIPLSPGAEEEESRTSPISIIWVDSNGKEHKSYPKVTEKGLEFSEGDEDLPDFFFFQSTHALNSLETAQRFSDLSRKGTAHDFIKQLTKEFRIIEDIGLEMVGGSTAIYAKVRGQTEKMPLANVSGGINRMVAIMLGISSRPNAVVLVDEVENGIYFQHQSAFWSSLLDLSRNHDSQLFLSTHSDEWLEALVDAADGNLDDISLWRLERTDKGPVVHQFTGKQVIAGIKAGEVR